MLVLAVVVIFGLLFAYLSTQNTALVTIRVADLTWTLPLYFIALASLFLGVAISWMLSLVDWISSALTIHSKEQHIKEKNEELENLQQRIHQLELENAKLKGEINQPEVVEETIDESPPKNFFRRLRHNLSI